MLNPNLQRLKPYPFEQLAALFADAKRPDDFKPIPLSIGEPQHAPPRLSWMHWLHTRAHCEVPNDKRNRNAASVHRHLVDRRSLETGSVNPDTNVIPVNGTREAIFAAVQAAVDRHAGGTVVMPNPFYQIYEGAAFMAGLSPYYLPIMESGQPDYHAVPDAVWKDCQFCFICTPGNPTGTVIDEATLAILIEKAHQFDFWLASDECYSEIYRNTPPPGLLEVCSTIGNTEFKKCIVFHSLSKRSNLPGLRSGFVAGDADFIRPFLKYRTYHGCSMSMAVQKASELAWADEEHVIENRALYAQKFRQAAEILGDRMSTNDPGAGFYLWAKTPKDCDTFSRELFEATGVTVLPDSILAAKLTESIQAPAL